MGFVPGRWVEGAGALSVLDEELARLGRHALAICDPFAAENMPETEFLPRLGDRVEIALESFGECTDEEAERLSAIPRADGADIVVGIGGGKALDLARATSVRLGPRVVIAPPSTPGRARPSAMSTCRETRSSFCSIRP